MGNEQNELVREARAGVDRAIAGLTLSSAADLQEAAQALEAAVSALSRVAPASSKSGALRHDAALLKQRLLLAMNLHSGGEQFYSGLVRLLSTGAAEYTRDGIVPAVPSAPATLTISG